MSVNYPSWVGECRSRFPALRRRENDHPVVFFDGPAGTQVPQSVVDAMSRYLLECNANHGGKFGTAIESDRWIAEAHLAFSDFVGANDADEIVFGQNMTSLTFAFSHAISQTWNPGDEIIVTALDHDANVSPWVLAARDRGVNVRWLTFRDDDFMLDMELFEQLISDKTKLVAVGCASNATGGVNDVKHIGTVAREHGALTYLDAVHYGPHGLIDVADWGCDFLACSAYKFFGPHIGIVWGRRRLLEGLSAYKVRPATNEIPGKWMTGTQSHESIAGAMAAVDYIADIGRTVAGDSQLGRRTAIENAFTAIRDYEQELSRQLLDGLNAIPGVKIWGINSTCRLGERFPTISITHETIPTPDLAKQLGSQGVYVWHGHYYALEFTERLDLEPNGMVRIGLVHYNTPDEIERLLNVIHQLTTAAIQ